MFFLMREHVFPCWDDKYNIDGGCVTLKVPKPEVHNVWAYLTARLVDNALLKGEEEGEDASIVNGISVSPKSYYCIVKVWLAREVDAQRDLNLPRGYHGDVLYKANRDTIRASQTTTQVACPAPAPGEPGTA